MSISALLVQASQQLSAELALPMNEARIESQALLRHVLDGVSRAWIILHQQQALTHEQRGWFNELLQRRLQGEPIAYILSRREFYGLDLAVTPDVLIPRADTETLVDAALQHIPLHLPCAILDLGTGSGAIAISLALHRPQSKVTAIDYSSAAIEVARGNAERLGADNLQLLQSDWFGALKSLTFDVMVSNPPYIAAADPHLKLGDLRFEPLCALASGTDGLNDIRSIVAQAPAYLATKGWLLLEHGYDQAPTVANLLQAEGFEKIRHATDLAGIQRVTLGQKP